jgi:hypothetical protein
LLTVAGSGGGVVDHGDGTYTVRFTPTAAGFYQLNVKVGDVQVSSNKLHVIPSEAVAAVGGCTRSNKLNPIPRRNRLVWFQPLEPIK